MNNKWVGSSTEAWTKKSNGNWRRRKTNIRTEVAGTFRELSCQFQSFESANKQNYNDKKVYKFIYNRTGGNAYSWWKDSEQFSSHYLFPPNGGLGSALEFHAVIDFCP